MTWKLISENLNTDNCDCGTPLQFERGPGQWKEWLMSLKCPKCDNRYSPNYLGPNTNKGVNRSGIVRGDKIENFQLLSDKTCAVCNKNLFAIPLHNWKGSTRYDYDVSPLLEEEDLSGIYEGIKARKELNNNNGICYDCYDEFGDINSPLYLRYLLKDT